MSVHGGGFVVRLVAKFDEEGSRGTWAIVDGWDGYEDLRGAGALGGTPQHRDQRRVRRDTAPLTPAQAVACTRFTYLGHGDTNVSPPATTS